MSKKHILIALIVTVLISLTGCLLPGVNDSTIDNSKKIIDVTPVKTEDKVYLSIAGVDYSGSSPIISIRWHNTTSYKVAFGEHYVIERLQGGEWINVAVKDKPVIEIGLIINERSIYLKNYTTDWVDLSENGTYRLRASYTLQHDNYDNYTTEDITIEFIVKDK